MNRYIRRLLIGLLAGAISSAILVAAFGSVGAGILLGIGVGCAYALAFRLPRGAYIDSAMQAALVGIMLWGSIDVVLFPLLTGRSPQWSAPEMRILLPVLIAWIVYGAIMGVLVVVFNDIASALLGLEKSASVPERVIKTRIVIVGGGFAGMTTAEHLEQAFGTDPSVSLLLVSAANSLLFTPMLAEVAGGSIEPTHISTPLRTSLRRTEVVHGRVERIDAADKRIVLAQEPYAEQPREIFFDHLVLALGSVSNYLGLEGVEDNALDFKSLGDAIRIREQVIDLLERADRETHAERRRAMLTFVIAGGGFAGAEIAGSLNDFVRGTLPYYPHIPPDEVRIILVHSRDTILPELSPTLGTYAIERMKARGVTFKLNTRLLMARKGAVMLKPAEEIKTETLIWTAGVRPHPLLKTLPATCDQRGAIIVNDYLAVPDLAGVWALGDCALVTDAKTRQTCPPTAQFALREAKVLASNIHATVNWRRPKPFHFAVLGVLCVVGYHTACAEIKGMRFSGFFAWLLWRGIYLSKLSGLERKLRVFSDWVIELFFPRDIVQTMEINVLRERDESRHDMNAAARSE